jgi:hypothetical protein
LLPGDPVIARQGSMTGEGYDEVGAEMRKQFGLDCPIYERYLTWAGIALRGDLGVSYITQKSVLELILQRLPATLELTTGTWSFPVSASFCWSGRSTSLAMHCETDSTRAYVGRDRQNPFDPLFIEALASAWRSRT